MNFFNKISVFQHMLDQEMRFVALTVLQAVGPGFESISLPTFFQINFEPRVVATGIALHRWTQTERRLGAQNAEGLLKSSRLNGLSRFFSS